MLYHVLFCTICYILHGLSQGKEISNPLINIDGSMEMGSNVANFLRNLAPPSLRAGGMEGLKKALWNKIFDGQNLRNLVKMKTSGGLDAWSAASSLLYNLANVLTKNTDGPIVQPSAEDKNQVSLLESMRLGRINGPVHIYGHHGGRNEKSAADDW